MYSLFKPIIFHMDPEQAHSLTLRMLDFAYRHGILKQVCPTTSNMTSSEIMGLRIPNPVGLAAGLDKNGAYIDALAALGFGFIEVGTVTPRPQSGNPKPRLFRLPEHQAIINKMGFNNDGIDALIQRIQKSRFSGVLGVNIGKNATTPIEDAASDYLECLEKAYPFASYITVNISSPNTKNLRTLQAEDELLSLLEHLKNRQAQLASQHGKYVPIAIKIAPDLSEIQIESIAKIAEKIQIDGIIATNTTINKDSLGSHPYAQEAGGLSGLPVRNASNSVLKQLSSLLNSSITLIGVGGIVSGEDAAEKIQLGASAVQIYSGLIYHGPKLINEAITACSERIIL